MTNEHEQTQPLLTVVIPSYNSQDYLDRALESVVGFDEVEAIIVNDGSRDATAEIADRWVESDPERIRAIHQENAGHGGAVNAGVAAARGLYLKILDSDDWLDREALAKVLDTLRQRRDEGVQLDLLVTNYVYEKQGKAHKRVIRYRDVIPTGRVVGWKEVRRCRYDQYLMMHSLILRTQMVRDSGMHLPEHTFYVDFLYSFIPFPLIENIEYLEVDLYRYFIGRDDQSVNEPVMISRLDQLLRVNRAMVDAMPLPSAVHPNLYRYMIHYLRINCVICTVMLMRSGTSEHLEAKEKLWADLQRLNPAAYRAVSSDLLGRLIAIPGRVGRGLTLSGYAIARAFVGFN